MLRLTVAALAVCVVSGCAKCKQLPFFNFENRLGRQERQIDRALEPRFWDSWSLSERSELRNDRQDIAHAEAELMDEYREDSKAEIIAMRRAEIERQKRETLRNPKKLVTDTNLRTIQQYVITSVGPSWSQLKEQAPKREKQKKERQQQQQRKLDEYERQLNEWEQRNREDEERRRLNLATGKKCCRCNECCCKCPRTEQTREPLIDSQV